MDAQVYRLSFNTGLHTGRRGVGAQESDHRFSADTLFSALMSQLALRDPDLIAPIVEAFPRVHHGEFLTGDAPFLLSSTFPFAGNVLLFPTPMLTSKIADGSVKALKKIKYVSQNIFNALLEGHDLAEFDTAAVKFQENSVLITRDECAGLPDELQADVEIEQHQSARPLMWRKLWHTEVRPRVWIDRETNSGNIFHHGQTLYRDGCGLWFAIHWREPAYPVGQYTMETILRMLLDDLTVLGLGGLRSYGLGAFTLSQPENLRLPDSAITAVHLSRFYPTPADTQYFNASGTSYRLVEVIGANDTAYARNYRRPLPMIEEGAVMAGNLTGCLVDTALPDAPHPRWRYGLAFPAGLRG